MNSRTAILFMGFGWCMAHIYGWPWFLESITMAAGLGLHWLLGQFDTLNDPVPVPDPYRPGKVSEK